MTTKTGLFILLVYTLSAIRYIAASDPLEVTSAAASGYSKDPSKVDRAMRASYSFPNSITAETNVDFQLPPWGPHWIFFQAPRNYVSVKLEGGEIYFDGFSLPHIFHSIKVKPTKGKSRVETLFKFKNGIGEDWWSS